MPSSPVRQITSSALRSKTVQLSKPLGSTRYALILGEIPLSFDAWMTSEQARAWLLSNSMPQTRRHKLLMECPVCSKLFSKSPSKLRVHLEKCETLTHTCSNACMGVMKTYLGTVELRCDECGGLFRISSSERARRLKRGDKHQFCSCKCSGVFSSKHHVGEAHHNYNRVEIICTHCKKTFLRTKGDTRGYITTNPFCSRACYGEWLVGRPTQKGTGRGSLRSYPPEFKQARAKMRDEGTLCAVCMYPAKELHHRDENIENNEPENLVPVCHRCHVRHHVGPPHPALSVSKKSTGM